MSKRALMVMMAAVSILGTVGAAQARAGGASEQHTQVQVVIDPEGSGRSEVHERVVTNSGKVMSERTFTQERTGLRTFAEMQPCARHGDRPGFVQHKPISGEYRTKNDFAEFQFFPFVANRARVSRVSNREQQQWLICGTGGMDSNNGSRVEIAGAGWPTATPVCSTRASSAECPG